MRNRGSTTWLLWAAAAAAVYYYLQSKGTITVPAQATPLSIYPEYAHTAQTSMAASPNQKVPGAPVVPTSYFAAVQGQEQAALLTQCVGSYPGCTVLMSDTQLGL